MFLCDKCAPKMGVGEFEMIFGSRSRGACESCGENKSCVDAHNFSKQNPENKEDTQEEDYSGIFDPY